MAVLENSKKPNKKRLFTVFGVALASVLVVGLSIFWVTRSFAKNFKYAHQTQMVFVCNEAYISGDYISNSGGEIAQSFFPSFETIKSIADFEYRYCALEDDVKLYPRLRVFPFRSISALELRFTSRSDYLNLIDSTLKVEEFEARGFGDYRICLITSKYTSLPDFAAVLICNDELNVATYMVISDIKYRTDAFHIADYIAKDMPAEWYYMGFYDAKKQTIIKHKIPTGSQIVGDSYTKEEDEYGRILFHTSATGEMLGDMSNGILDVYIICQKYDDEFVWFYDDECLIYSDDPAGEVSNDRIEAFKSANDWGKPLNEEKCTSRRILTTRLENPVAFNKEAMENCISDLLQTDSFVYDVCDSDSNGKILVFARSKDYTKEHLNLGSTVVAIVSQNEDGSYRLVENGSANMNDMLDTKTIISVKKAGSWQDR